MAFGHARTGAETLQVQMDCLDDLVPADGAYRRVERLVSWPAVRASAAPSYIDVGRPSIDPAVREGVSGRGDRGRRIDARDAQVDPLQPPPRPPGRTTDGRCPSELVYGARKMKPR